MSNEEMYPCKECGKLRTKAEGGTTFTICDECWDKLFKKRVPVPKVSGEDKGTRNECPRANPRDTFLKVADFVYSGLHNNIVDIPCALEMLKECLISKYGEPTPEIKVRQGKLAEIGQALSKRLSIAEIESGISAYQLLPNGNTTLNDEFLNKILAWHSAIVADLNRQHEDKLNRVIDEAVHAVEELYREHKYQGKSIGKVRDEAIAKIQALKENGK